MEASMRLHASALNKLKKFLSKSYRDAYLDNSVRSGIAYQIQSLRKARGLSQSEFALKLGKPQSTVCRLEQEAYGRVSVTTLLDVAKALDVGLVVRFTSYVSVLAATSRMSERDLEVDTIFETVEKSLGEERRSALPRIHTEQIWAGLSDVQAAYGSPVPLGRFPRSTFAVEGASSANAVPSYIQSRLQ